MEHELSTCFPELGQTAAERFKNGIDRPQIFISLIHICEIHFTHICKIYFTSYNVYYLINFDEDYVKLVKNTVPLFLSKCKIKFHIRNT